MSFLTDTLYPPSFKGAKFYFTDEVKKDGRRTIEHRYPKKGDDLEDNGKDSRVFNINGLVTGFFFKEDAKALESKLNETGPGILVHPEIGNVTCRCRGFTRSFNLKTLGTIHFSMVFKEVFEDVSPLPTSDVTTRIAELYNKFYTFAEKYLKLRYIVDTKENIIKAAEKLSELTDQLRSLSDIAISQVTDVADPLLVIRRF